METKQVSGPPDSELVRKVQAGDSRAFELLARRYYRPVFSLVASHMPASNEVEDVVQDTFLPISTVAVPGRPKFGKKPQAQNVVAQDRTFIRSRRCS